jgi:copper chaperone CopZ
MNSYRRKVRAHQAATAQYAADMEAWQAPLVWPAQPNEPCLPYPVHGNPVYCPDCTYDIKAKLSKLDGAACVYLRESDGLRGENDQAKVSSSSEARTLSPTIEDLDEFDGWLRDWKAAYLGTDTMARQGQLSDSITLGASWLVVRVERILARRELGQAFGEEVAGWYAKLRRYDPSEVVVERLKGVRCPECGGLTLERKVGDDKVICRMMTCERVLKLSEYRELTEDAKKARKAS